MGVNGEAIYDSRTCRRLSSAEDFCFFTSKEVCDYLIAMQWVTDDLAIAIADGRTPTACALLCDGKMLDVPGREGVAYSPTPAQRQW